MTALHEIAVYLLACDHQSLDVVPAAGHIVGAVNAPSESFAQDAAVDAVIDDKLNGGWLRW